MELLVTMALIVVLFVVFYGSSSRSRQEKLKVACQQNLQTLHVALQLYAGDHEGVYPARPGARSAEEPLSLLWPRYISVTSRFHCPGSKEDRLPEGESFEKKRISYAYYMGRHQDDGDQVLMSDWQVNTQPKEPGQPLFSADGKPPGNNHRQYGGNLLFCDGRVTMTGVTASFPIPVGEGVELLNPRP